MTLCALLTALAPFNSRELFEFSMPLLYKPTPLVLVLNPLRVNRTGGTICDDPFNVTVCGNSLEKRHFQGDFLEFNGNTVLELFVRPVDLLSMNRAVFLAEADSTIFLQSRDKVLVKPMNIVKIFRSRRPSIEQNHWRFNPFFFKSWVQHIPEVILVGFTINLRGIPAKIQWMIIALIGMNSIDHPDSFH
jgi:hypothetical protein